MNWSLFWFLLVVLACRGLFLRQNLQGKIVLDTCIDAYQDIFGDSLFLSFLICHIERQREFLCFENCQGIKCFHWVGAVTSQGWFDAGGKHILAVVERITNKQLNRSCKKAFSCKILCITKMSNYYKNCIGQLSSRLWHIAEIM